MLYLDGEMALPHATFGRLFQPGAAGTVQFADQRLQVVHRSASLLPKVAQSTIVAVAGELRGRLVSHAVQPRRIEPVLPNLLDGTLSGLIVSCSRTSNASPRIKPSSPRI